MTALSAAGAFLLVYADYPSLHKILAPYIKTAQRNADISDETSIGIKVNYPSRGDERG